jgi:2-oxoglutarate dehydrogenase E1 component
VVRSADELDFADFMSRYDDLVSRARANRLSADDLADISLTLTNPGTVGTTASVPRLMPGQGAIVATGAVRQGPAGAVMTVSSTYDHRIIQGAESGRFLATLEQFLAGADGFYESIAESLGVPLPAVGPTVRAASSIAGSPASLSEVAAGVDLVRSFRQFGHRAADLDPLGSPPPGDEALDPASWGLNPESMARIPADVLRVDLPGSSLADVLGELRATYCGRIAYEVEHINSHEERS